MWWPSISWISRKALPLDIILWTDKSGAFPESLSLLDGFSLSTLHGALIAELLPSHSHPKIRALYAYWLGKRRGRPMPSRPDLDPVEIPTLLPHVFLVDVPGDGGPLVYRLSGTAVVALMGQDVTGQRVGDGTLPQHRAEVVARYGSVAREGRPFFHQARLRDYTNDFADVDRILLPLSGDGVRVNMLLGMTIRRLDAASGSVPGQ
jgi:hypothetical protein